MDRSDTSTPSGASHRVTTPAQRDVAAVAGRVRIARNSGEPLRVVGAGTWLDAGPPTPAQHLVSVADLTGVVAYVPGDLTITVRAGTTLADIAQVTAEARQWLALDPFGSNAGTIGATIATGSSGPLATAFGTPRDSVLGLEAVTGTGAVIHVGGRVVKNVAGFDLARLLCGSWGTLGVITEATLRLRAFPEREETLATQIDEAPDSVQALRDQTKEWPFTPFAMEVLDRALAERVGLGTSAVMVTRLGGNPESLRAQRAAVETLGDTSVVDPAVWERLRDSDRDSAAVVRLSHLPSRIGELWAASREISRRWPGALCEASPSRGIIRCVLPRRGTDRAAEVTAIASALYIGVEATRSYERLPPELWASLSPRPGIDSMEQRVKRAFDPAGVLNRGMLGLNG
jgi:glycolate oxidase FAD binding subunit